MSSKAEIHDLSALSSSMDNAPTLRRAFRANALFSLVTGLILLFGSNPVAVFLGIHQMRIFNLIPGASFLLEFGVGILVFAAWVGYTATRYPIGKRSAIAILVADALWVIDSALLLATNALPLTTQGLWAVLIVADIVLALAIWEFVGIRRMAAH